MPGELRTPIPFAEQVKINLKTSVDQLARAPEYPLAVALLASYGKINWERTRYRWGSDEK